VVTADRIGSSRGSRRGVTTVHRWVRADIDTIATRPNLVRGGAILPKRHEVPLTGPEDLAEERLSQPIGDSRAGLNSGTADPNPPARDSPEFNRAEISAIGQGGER
jgi:hypothetical protein